MAVLTIGGSCPDGGAGIQMDLKVFDATGAVGASVITALTSQNTRETRGLWWVPPEVVLSQLSAVFSDMDIKAVKIGMVGNPEVARAVYGFLKGKKVPVVLDPVMKAQADGGSLFDQGAMPELKKLISISEVVVANTSEAGAIAGLEVETISDAEDAADRILKLGAKAVLVTGVKTGVVSDLFKSDFKFTYTKQLKLGGTKGGGACISSAIAAYLSMGISEHSAVEYAEGFVDGAIAGKKKIGKGIESLDPLSTLRKDADRYEVISSMKAALAMLESHNEFSPFIPQAGSNMAFAIRNARTTHDVAAVVGRIRDAMGVPRSLGDVEFGASGHVASILLYAMALDPEKRAAISIAQKQGLEQSCKKAGFAVGRLKQKPQQKGKGKQPSFAMLGKKVPPVIFEDGGAGREPIAIAFGRDPMDAVSTALKIIATAYRTGK